jgi:hypothetical protein
MVMFPFGGAVLLVGVRTRDAMGNTQGAKEGVVNFLIFPTPIELNTFDLSVNETLYMSLKTP